MQTLAIALIIVCLAAFSCYAEAVPFTSVPHDRDSRITLEARRVKSISGDYMAYDLGKETIKIKADSFASQRFLKDVKSGRATAHQNVTLQPIRKSPFNKDFKAR